MDSCRFTMASHLPRQRGRSNRSDAMQHSSEALQRGSGLRVESRQVGRARFPCRLSVLRRKTAMTHWVGLLARRGRLAMSDPTFTSPSPALHAEWRLSKRPALTYSGGTAPDFHRLPRYAAMAPRASHL